MKCKYCKKNELKRSSYHEWQERCTACSFEYIKELKRKKAELERKKKALQKEFAVAQLPRKKCIICNNSFKPSSVDEKYCHNPCNYKMPDIAGMNKRWLDRKFEKNPKRRKIDSNMIAYGFFRKKYGVKDKFRVCRG